jgi:hypothetical protein
MAELVWLALKAAVAAAQPGIASRCHLQLTAPWHKQLTNTDQLFRLTPHRQSSRLHSNSACLARWPGCSCFCVIWQTGTRLMRSRCRRRVRLPLQLFALMWSSPDVIGLFSNNVVSFSRNVVLRDPLFSLNSVSNRGYYRSGPFMFSVRYT